MTFFSLGIFCLVLIWNRNICFSENFLLNYGENGQNRPKRDFCEYVLCISLWFISRICWASLRYLHVCYDKTVPYVMILLILVLASYNVFIKGPQNWQFPNENMTFTYFASIVISSSKTIVIVLKITHIFATK